MPNKPPHGNAKDSLKKQHLYEIKDAVLPDDDNTFKYGVSGSVLNKDGSSPRANAQVNKLNMFARLKRFGAVILDKDIDGREEALQIGKGLTEKYQDEHGGDMPDGMLRPDKRKKQ